MYQKAPMDNDFHYHIIEGVEMQDLTDDDFEGAVCFGDLSPAIKYIKGKLAILKVMIAKDPIVNFISYKRANDLVSMLEDPNPRQVAAISATGIHLAFDHLNLILAPCKEDCTY